MLNRILPAAALLIGFAALPALAQEAPAPTSEAARTLAQNSKVQIGLPPAPPPSVAQAQPPAPQPVLIRTPLPRRMALASGAPAAR